MTDTKPYLQIKGLAKKYGDNLAVKPLELDIYQHEIFALLGSSGSGKSTLLRMLAGMEKPTDGQIILDGQDITHLAPYDRPINMMFQSYALFPHMTVADNIAFGLKQDKLPKDEIAARVDEMLRLVQMPPNASRTNYRAVSSSVSLWRVRWRNAQNCCCWTNLWVRWIKNCASKPSLNWSIRWKKWA